MLSERIKKGFNKHDLVLTTKTIIKVQNVFTRTKYTIPSNNKSKLVYRVKYKHCDLVYIGETKQKIKDRMYRHELDIHNKKTCH